MTASLLGGIERRDIMGRRHYIPIWLLVLAGTLVIGATASLASAGVTQLTTGDLISAHVLQNQNNRTILAWSTTSEGLAVSYQDSTDVEVIRGNTARFWTDGALHEEIRYHYGGLWRAVQVRFGITRNDLAHAFTSGTVVALASPLRRPAAARNAPPPTVTTVDNFGVNVSALSRAARFPVRYGGERLLGYQLADSSIATVKNPYRQAGVSGPIASIIYSSNPGQLGVGDHRITINFMDETSQAGRANDGFLGGGRASITVGETVAFKANANQIVFRVGKAIGVVTSTLVLTDSQWQAILGSLRSP